MYFDMCCCCGGGGTGGARRQAQPWMLPCASLLALFAPYTAAPIVHSAGQQKCAGQIILPFVLVVSGAEAFLMSTSQGERVVGSRAGWAIWKWCNVMTYPVEMECKRKSIHMRRCIHTGQYQQRLLRKDLSTGREIWEKCLVSPRGCPSSRARDAQAILSPRGSWIRRQSCSVDYRATTMACSCMPTTYSAAAQRHSHGRSGSDDDDRLRILCRRWCGTVSHMPHRQPCLLHVPCILS